MLKLIPFNILFLTKFYPNSGYIFSILPKNKALEVVVNNFLFPQLTINVPHHDGRTTGYI